MHLKMSMSVLTVFGGSSVQNSAFNYLSENDIHPFICVMENAGHT